jgi:hypothetical protein
MSATGSEAVGKSIDRSSQVEWEEPASFIVTKPAFSCLLVSRQRQDSQPPDDHRPMRHRRHDSVGGEGTRATGGRHDVHAAERDERRPHRVGRDTASREQSVADPEERARKPVVVWHARG